MAAWDVTSYFYSGKSAFLSGLPGVNDVFFRDDGTSFYVVDNVGDLVREYSLSTAWDVSTAIPGSTFSVASQASNPLACFIGDSGNKLYVTGSSSDAVHEYDLSTAWSVSTATFNQSFSVLAQEQGPTGLYFRDNGTKMFVIGILGDDVYEYTLSTAWDVSTASFVDSFSVNPNSPDPQGIGFGDSGSKFYIASGSGVFQYDMTTAWDISTASYVDSLSVSSQSTDVRGVFIRGNGDNLYAAGSNDTIFQYNQPTVITAAATMAGTSTFTALPANITAVATMAGVGALSGVGSFATATKGRAVDEASAGGTSAALSVSLNSAITEPANPTRNT